MANRTVEELEKQLRERGLEVVALREALTSLRDSAMVCAQITEHHPIIRAVNDALSNTSATAQRVRAEIEREALEKAVQRVFQIATLPKIHDMHIRATILGEKEKG